MFLIAPAILAAMIGAAGSMAGRGGGAGAGSSPSPATGNVGPWGNPYIQSGFRGMMAPQVPRAPDMMGWAFGNQYSTATQPPRSGGLGVLDRIWDSFLAPMFGPGTGRGTTPPGRPAGMPSFEELGETGRQAALGEYRGALTTRDLGMRDRRQQGRDVEGVRGQLEETGSLYERLLTEGVDRDTADRAQWQTDYEGGLEDLREGLRYIQDQPDKIEEFITNRIDDAVAAQRAEYQQMRAGLETMNEEARLMARNRTAELIQEIASGSMSEVLRQQSDRLADPEFQNMSADQQYAAIGAIQMGAVRNITGKLLETGASENSRIDAEALERDKFLAAFDVSHDTTMGALRGQLETAGFAEVGVTVREAMAQTGIQTRAMADFRENMNTLRNTISKDFREWGVSLATNRATIETGLSTLILQGDMDSFNMGQALKIPVLDSYLSAHMASMFQLGFGIMQPDYVNRLSQNAGEVGRFGLVFDPFLNPAPGAVEEEGGWSTIPGMGAATGGFANIYSAVKGDSRDAMGNLMRL